MTNETMKQALELSEHSIPQYAYGDNEAACEMVSRLEKIAEILRAAIDSEQAKGREAVAWRDHVEQRLLNWRQRQMSRSGDRLALDDFMDKVSLDDLIDYVCDEYATPPAQPAREFVGLSDDEVIEIGNETHRAMPDGADDQQELLAIYQNIESALREKNAGQPVVKEN